MKLTARKVHQNGVTFFETALPAITITDEKLVTPDRWNPMTKKGYQREISTTSVADLVTYLREGTELAILPTNVTLNARTPFKITELKDGIVEIEIKDFPLYVIDGQHRIMGLRQAIVADTNDRINEDTFELGVTLTQFDLRDEMYHFRNINSRQHRPPRSLSDTLTGTLATDHGIIPNSSSERGRIRATEVIYRLGTDSDSPWYNRIALGGIHRRSFHMGTQAALTSSITPMFTNGRFGDEEESIDHIYSIFRNWWSALAEVYPQAFEHPVQYTFMRNQGYIVWNRVLGRILTNWNFNPTRDQMLDALTEQATMNGWESETWKINNRDNPILASVGRTGKLRLEAAADAIWSELDKDLLKEKKVEEGS